MKGLRVAVILLVVLEAGWITFDGAQALRTGAYLKPRLGAYGGRVGEWTRVASVLGAPGGSTRAKWALIGYGVAWLCAAFAFARSQVCNTERTPGASTATGFSAKTCLPASMAAFR